MRCVTLGVLVAAVFAGCGGGASDSASEPCAVVESGNELCGERLRAWCDKFADTSDADTAQACGEFYPALSSDDPVLTDLSEDFDGDGRPNGSDLDPYAP